MGTRTRENQYLLVEGMNDKYAILDLWRKYNQYSSQIDNIAVKPVTKLNVCPQCSLPQTLTVQHRSMPTVLQKNFRQQLRADDTEVVGIVIDADVDFAYQWQEVKKIIEETEYGYNVPDLLPDEGLVLESPDGEIPRLGVWIMPDNQSFGELEDFVVQLIPTDDRLMPYADQVLNSLEADGLNKYKRSKARIYTWLAWQKEPVQMGRAITENILAQELPNPEIAKRFVEWLNALFLSDGM